MKEIQAFAVPYPIEKTRFGTRLSNSPTSRRPPAMCSSPVLVTGATGFIGGHLIPALQSRGHTIHAISRRNPQRPTPGVTYHTCDITDSGALRPIVQSRSWHAIVHLAGLVSYTSDDAIPLYEINVRGTETLINLIERYCSQTRFILCSSVAAVGSNKKNTDPLLNEDAKWDSNADGIGYLRTKRLAEELVSAAAAAGRINASIVCPSNVYGARDGTKASRKTQVKAANGQWPIYTKGGVNVVHVRIVVQAFLELVGDIPDDDPLWKGQRWLVVGENVTIRDMLTMCAEFGGNPRDAPWVCLPEWLLWILCFVGQILGSRNMTLDRFAVATRFHWFDGTRAQQKFCLEDVPAREALRESVEWMRTQGMVKHR